MNSYKDEASQSDCRGGLQASVHQKSFAVYTRSKKKIPRPNKLIIGSFISDINACTFPEDVLGDIYPQDSFIPQLIMVTRAALSTLGHCWMSTGVVDQ